MASGTYGELQYQIADELGQRGDLLVPSTFLSGTLTITLSLSPIQKAIQNAIAKWERTRFYFNELTFDAYSSPWFSTTLGTEFYGSSTTASIASVAQIDKLHVLISGNRYFMVPRTWQYLTDVSINPTNNGQPVDYAYANYQLRMYPIPNGVYPVGVYGTQRLAALSALTDSNAWTLTAEPLIRATAKEDIFRNVLQEKELADDQFTLVNGGVVMGRRVNGYLYDLKAETSRRVTGNKFKPSYF